MNNDKKISFGFKKITKKSTISTEKEKSIELIDCIEENSIKIKNEIKKEPKKPLIIPQPSTNTLLDRIRDAHNKNQTKNEEKNIKTEKKLTLNELAAQELINEAQNLTTEKTRKKNLKLPNLENKPIFDGENEPTLENYNDIPVEDFGMAMLRGMGWKEGMSIGKTQKKTITNEIPELRPKGLGLGANKILKLNKPTTNDANQEKLILKKNTYAKIIAGHYDGNYCQILGFDEHAGRIIIKTACDGIILTINEFLLKPITKDEYYKQLKILDKKYEETSSSRKSSKNKKKI